MIWIDVWLRISSLTMCNNIIAEAESTGACTSTSGCNSQTSRQTNFRDFIHSILPPTPDRRLVELRQPTATAVKPDTGSVSHTMEQETVGLLQQHILAARNVDITASNTTLIGNYTSVVFPPTDSKWLVQGSGVTLHSHRL